MFKSNTICTLYFFPVGPYYTVKSSNIYNVISLWLGFDYAPQTSDVTYITNYNLLGSIE